MPSETTTKGLAPARALSKEEWIVSLRQLTALRVFWLGQRHTVCGAAWIADYGPLPCDRPHGHDGRHRTYGSQGPIEWGTPTRETDDAR